MADTSIPASVEEVTPEWLSAVLDAEVRSVSTIDAHSGTTGRLVLALEGDASVPASVFVKLQPFSEQQRRFLQMTGLGVAEARFYAAVGNDLPVRSPRVWAARHNDERGSFVMVLEDLSAAGCTFPSAEDPDVLGVTESLVVELAALHARFWGDELGWLARHSVSAGGGKDRAETGAALIRSAGEQFGSQLQPGFQRMVDYYAGHHAVIARLWAEGETTLIHGDDHVGNLFVDGGRTGFFDWAVASRFPGMRDVAYFLCNSLPTEVRRESEQVLIERYRSALARHGSDLDASVAERQYRLFSVYSWVAATTTAAMGDTWQPADVGRRAMERTTQALIDLDVLDLLEQELAS